jgi:hypothetical protein
MDPIQAGSRFNAVEQAAIWGAHAPFNQKQNFQVTGM